MKTRILLTIILTLTLASLCRLSAQDAPALIYPETTKSKTTISFTMYKIANKEKIKYNAW